MKKRQSFSLWVVVLVAAAALASPALATEGGGGAYPNGAEGFMAGALPPPGTYFINYLTYYTASKFKDNNGNDAPGDFKLKVAADVLRFVHVTNYKVLGANWAVHAFIPIAYQDVSVPGRDDDRFGLGDIIIDPIILGWHSRNVHVTVGLDIYIPTGSYNKDRLANIGRNYWTFEPVLGVTFLSDGGFEVSAKFMYDINTENDDTKYRSGQEFHVDYTVGYHIGKEW
nr:transporter [Syntrophales bacterium]